MTDLKQELLELVRREGSINCTLVSERLGYTRQAVHRHLRELVNAGELVVTGHARATRYSLPASVKRLHRLDLADVDEREVWARVAPELVPPTATLAATAIAEFAVEELVKNAASHSAAASATLQVDSTLEQIRFQLSDEGVGLFTRVRERLGLGSELDALIELSRAPLTTEPRTHLGQGLLLLASACDQLTIEAGGLLWQSDRERGDQLLGEAPRRPGTRVTCAISADTELALDALLRQRLARQNPLAAIGQVKLVEHGGQFVSREEARRLMEGMERYRVVDLNFHGISGVGLGFAQELFQRWVPSHPGTRIQVRGAGPVILRVLRDAGAHLT
ncbi:MAG: winged helix-turn-helix transcriptional regulator [Polyangiaceae bacterium]|nr:winged helix-turn-helix transcriptional regulator [Polyangiaceae bacterium]MCW5791409.1 winged helix-turn-helix transcriptional regulator [Polyangiaceae bacterium]